MSGKYPGYDLGKKWIFSQCGQRLSRSASHSRYDVIRGTTTAKALMNNRCYL